MTYREAYARMLEQDQHEWDIPPEEIDDYCCPDHVIPCVQCKCPSSWQGEQMWDKPCAECWDREAPEYLTVENDRRGCVW